jgi:hypothetical protein
LDNLGADAFGGANNGDVLMNDVQAKPKRTPPARLAGKEAVQKPKADVLPEDQPLKKPNLEDMPIQSSNKQP